MKRTLSALLAALLLIAGLSACTSTSGVIPGTSVTLGQIGSINSINPDVAGAIGGERNASELANLTTAKFFDQDANGQLVANEKLGTVEVISTAPLKVRYSLSDGATWSDGTAIDAADLALSVAAGSSLAGVNFYSMRSASGLALASLDGSESLGQNSITVKFSSPVADYRTAVTLSVAAHTIGQIIDSTLDPIEAKKLVLQAIQSKDTAALAKISEAYRSGFNTWNGISDKKLFVSSGPYQVTKVDGKSGLTLKANPGFKLGAMPSIETIELGYFVDSTAAISAMADGKLDATTTLDSGLVTLADILGLVGEIKTQTVTPAIRSSSVAEQVIFNFGAKSRFSAMRNGGDSAKALALRQAFLNLVPRNRIVSGLSTAYQLSTADSLVFHSSSNYYKASAQDNGLNQYLLQDAEKSAEMLSASGVSLPLKVRVAYDITNPRAQAEWILLSERAANAGFKLKAVGGEDLSATLASGDFEVYLGPRPLVSLPDQNAFSLTSESFVSYQNDGVQAALAEYASASGDQDRAAALKKIDELLVADAYGMPLYEVPSLVVYTDRIVGFKVSPRAESVTWGYQFWSIKPKS